MNQRVWLQSSCSWLLLKGRQILVAPFWELRECSEGEDRPRIQALQLTQVGLYKESRSWLENAQMRPRLRCALGLVRHHVSWFLSLLRSWMFAHNSLSLLFQFSVSNPIIRG